MHVCEQLYLGHVPERSSWPHGELLLQCVACGSRDTYPAAPGLPRGCRGLPPRVHSRWAGPTVQLVVVLEQWAVVDRWWTGEPVRTEYRAYALAGMVRTEQLGAEGWQLRHRERVGTE